MRLSKAETSSGLQGRRGLCLSPTSGLAAAVPRWVDFDVRKRIRTDIDAIIPRDVDGLAVDKRQEMVSSLEDARYQWSDWAEKNGLGLEVRFSIQGQFLVAIMDYSFRQAGSLLKSAGLS